MPAAPAAKFDVTLDTEEYSYRTASLQADEARRQQRLRVVRRKGVTARPRKAGSRMLGRALAFGAAPALLLFAYVLSWTLVMCGGYQRDQLRAQLEQVRLERVDLETEKLRYQAPGRVFNRAARELGMQPGYRREFIVTKQP